MVVKDVEKSSGTVLSWVTQYGIATVFAVMLLMSLLYSNYQVQAQILSISQSNLETLKDIQKSQSEIVKNQIEFSRIITVLQERTR